MAHRPKRRAGFAAGNKSKMSAEEYEQLIGQFEHIEHKALHSEIAREFAEISQNRKSGAILANDFLYPSQPPPLPMEANTSKNISFRRSTPWPTYSIIQRSAHMLFYSMFESEIVEKYLQKINIPQIQIDIAFEVLDLMEQSIKYWRKLNHLKNEYEQRYNSVTRKYALRHATWPLQIAMTLLDFHMDHIVDIVYKKEPIWSNDYDLYCEQKRKEKLRLQKPNMNHEMNNEMDNEMDNNYYDSTATTSYDEEDEYEQWDSEHEIIDGGAHAQYVNKVADHMSVEQLQAIKDKVQQQKGVTLEALFENMFADMPVDQKNIAFADDFEIDLNDSKDEQDEKGDGGILELNKLYGKYPELDKGLIQQTYRQKDRNFNESVIELDLINSQTNAFFNAHTQK